MNRRTVLASTGVAITSLAGCIAGQNGRRPSSTRTETGPQRLSMGGSVEIDDDTSLTVADPTVQKSIITDQSPFLTIEREDGLQFVVVDVDGSVGIDPSRFVLERDGRIANSPEIQRRVRGVVRTCDGTCIGAPVPAAAVDSLAIAYRTTDTIRAVWEFEEATITALPEVPDLRLRNATFVDQDGDVGIEFTVENVGDRDGGFRALIAPTGVADVTEPVGFAVPQTETVTTTVIPSELQTLTPGEAVFTEEPTEDTRYFEIDSSS